jgi:hypothetical protein
LLAISYIKLISFVNSALWIFAMVNNFLELLVLVLVAFFVNLTQKMFRQNIIGYFLAFTIKKLNLVDTRVQQWILVSVTNQDSISVALATNDFSHHITFMMWRYHFRLY